MVYRNINELIRDLKRVLTEEEEIDLSKIDEYILRLIDKNRNLYKESRDPYVREYLDSEYSVLIELLLSWRRYIVYKFLKGEENRLKITFDSNIEKIINLVNEFLRVRDKENILGIVKKEIPPFVGSDGREYGPFIPGDIILINRKDFGKLKKRGLVEDIKIDI
jgi:hypothetical protein